MVDFKETQVQVLYFQVFIKCSGSEDVNLPFTHTKFFAILDRYENTVRVNVNLPPFIPGIKIMLRPLGIQLHAGVYCATENKL